MEIQCLFMEKRINFQKKLLKTIENLGNRKPKLLLHVCCGPCFTMPNEILKNYFDITIMYNNSNIYPEQEYTRRIEELKWYLNKIGSNIQIIETTYNNEEYIKELLPYKDESEGHNRCRICFKKRLREGFKYAYENGFEYYGTVMTISRYKNAQDINKIGEELQNDFPDVKWLYADFKKNDGYEKSLKIINENNMYLQHYCGCQFSYQKFIQKNSKMNEK